MRFLHLLLFSLLIISALKIPSSDALWGKEKDHSVKAKESAYESAVKAREAAEKAYEAAKEATLGVGKGIGDTAGAARDKLGDTAGAARESVSDTIEAARLRLEAAREKLANTAGAARDGVSEILESARNTLEAARERVSETVGSLYEGAKDRAGNLYEGAKDRAEDLYEGAKDRAEDIYEGTKDRAGNVYEGAKDRVQDTAEGLRERTAQMAGKARETGEHVRGRAEDLYDDASARAHYAKIKSQSWLNWLWNAFIDIVMFIPRTIRDAMVWSWHTTCDVSHDIYEGGRQRAEDARDRAGHYTDYAREKVGDTAESLRERAESAKERVGDTVERVRDSAGDTAQQARGYGEQIVDRAGQVKDSIAGQGRRVSDVIGEKLHQAGEYVSDRSSQYESQYHGGGGGERVMERAREMGEQATGRVRESKNWMMCQAQRVGKFLFTLTVLTAILLLSFVLLLSPQSRERFRQRFAHFRGFVRQNANALGQRISPYVPNSFRRFFHMQPVPVGGEKLLTTDEAAAAPIPTRHYEKKVEEREEIGKGTSGGTTSYTTRSQASHVQKER